MIGVLNVYLAARYSRREELLRYVADLEERGYIVTSRWLQGSHQIDDAGLSVEAKREERERFAHEDWEDLKGSMLVFHSQRSRGLAIVVAGAM
jgi:hypothetical protein